MTPLPLRYGIGLSFLCLNALAGMASGAPETEPSLSVTAPATFSGADIPLDAISLDQAVDLALGNNPDLGVANERIGQAQAQLGQALAAFYPQIKGRVSYEHSTNPARVFSYVVAQRDFSNSDFVNINNPGSRENFRPEVIGNLSLFRGGQDYQRTKVAELGVETATLQHTAVRNDLIQAVTSAYYGVLAAQESHDVAAHSIKAVESELGQTRTRLEAGSALKSDVLSLEVQLAQARESEIATAIAIELALAGLKTLLGLGAKEPLRLSQSAAPAAPEPTTAFDTALTRALAQRPEMAIAQREVEMGERRVKIARAAHLPRADAYVSYGTDRKDFGISTRQDNVTAGVAMEVDLFSGFGTHHKVRQAERQLEQAREAQRRTRLQIEYDVRSAFLGLQEAMQRLQVTSATVAAAEEAWRLVRDQHQAGAATVTRYIEAEVARDNALSRVIAARYDAFRAEAELKRAMGDSDGSLETE